MDKRAKFQSSLLFLLPITSEAHKKPLKESEELYPLILMMKNKTIAGFSITKCSAFQFLKKRVRRWIRSPKVNVDKHQHTHLINSDTFVKATSQNDADPQLRCQSTCQECHVCQVMAINQDIKVGTRANGKICKVRRWKKSEKVNPDKMVTINTDNPEPCASQKDKVPKLAAQSSIMECHCCQVNITHKSDGPWETRKSSKAKKQCQGEHQKHPSEKLFTINCNPGTVRLKYADILSNLKTITIFKNKNRKCWKYSAGPTASVDRELELMLQLGFDEGSQT
ncbi:uncharacterized protein [Heterodontus francisci]|uniref:uncharacterized protein n=1 Tax=Heterodontus francisci TaxID=7792 RepID=UPI00355BDD95